MPNSSGIRHSDLSGGEEEANAPLEFWGFRDHLKLSAFFSLVNIHSFFIHWFQSHFHVKL